MLNTDITEYYRATIDSDSHLKRSVSFLNTFLVPAYLDSRSAGSLNSLTSVCSLLIIACIVPSSSI